MKQIQRSFLACASTAAAMLLTAAAFVTPKQTLYAADTAASANLVHDRTLFTEKCSACHNLPNPEELSMNRIQWTTTVQRMRVKYGAADLISPDEASQIVDYLATFAPKPNNRGNGGARDLWGADATDVWTVAPAATRIFNFESGPELTGLSAVAAGASGPAPLWSVVSDSAGANGSVVRVHAIKPNPARFALLVDRRETARNLDVRVRFRIDRAGKSPTVGIAFGFTNANSYDLLVYKAKTSELVLMHMAEPVHTVVQTTPLNTGAVQTVSAPAGALLGWHTLRLLVKDGQIRGWLDGNKRISAQDAAYSGGKVGLWTQGDTVASFDDWTIDVYDAAAPSSDLPNPTMP